MSKKIKVMTVEAKVGWEVADGKFYWDIEKKFDSEFDAQNWVENLIKAGNFDAGEVEKIK